MASNRIVSNAKWIIACKVAQSLIQLAIGMLTARYLGPSNYGLIGYAASVTAFALPVMQLGLQSTLIQEMIETPEQEGGIMGTALAMDLISGMACIGMVCAFVGLANPGETETLAVCALYSLSLIFRAAELMQCWFQYKLESKYPSIVMLCSYIIVSVYKIYILAASRSIYWFTAVNSIDFGITGIALIVIYRKLAGQRLSISLDMAERLIKRSKFYILAAMMVTVFQNTDHIMLKMMIGDAENGFYTAAVTCMSVCQFLYTAVTDSARPVVLSSRRENREAFERNVSRLYCVMIYMALIQGVGFSVFARLIVGVLYGEEYLAAVPVLRIMVWQIAFSFMGSVRNMWILAEGKQNLVWKLNLTGAVLNVAVNWVLIPRWGACGAAAASLATQVFTNFVLGFAVRPLRENNRLLVKGLDPRLIIEMIKKKAPAA